MFTGFVFYDKNDPSLLQIIQKIKIITTIIA